jgi:hypothetical protein
MDIKQYYRKIREIEAKINEPFPLVVSLDTPDGGKRGVISEVPRAVAAKLLAESRAVLATEEEREQYWQQQFAARKASEQAQLARTVQVAIVSDPELRLRSGRKISVDSKSGE